MKYLESELSIATEGIGRFALFEAFLALMGPMMRPAQS